MKRSKTKSIAKSVANMIAIGNIVLMLVIEVLAGYTYNKNLVKDTKASMNQTAKLAADDVTDWLDKQSASVLTIADSAAFIGSTDHDALMNYLALCLEQSDDALMYYICFEYDKSVNAANHADLSSLDPTTRSWWDAAIAAGQGNVAYTDPYVDFATGQMVVTISSVTEIGGKRAVVLADICVDKLVEKINALNSDSTSAFLVNSEGNVVVHYDESLMPTQEGDTNLYSMVGFAKGEIDTTKSTDYDGKSIYVATKTIDSTGWTVGLVQRTRVIERLVQRFIVLLIFLGVACTALTVIFLIKRIKKYLQPLDDIETFVVDNVLNPETKESFARRVFKTQSEEISYLLSELKISFVDVVRQTKAETADISGSMGTISGNTTSINESIMDISAIMEETGANIETQTHNVDQISSSCSESRNSAEELAQAAEKISDKARDITARVAVLVPEIVEGKKKAVSKTEVSKKRLENAMEDAKKINEITEVSASIKGIASQTNLLALNASIEAARAGEAGKGFAVVAEEIGKLASTTSEQTTKIDSLLSEVVRSVNTLSDESESVITFLNDTVIKDYGMLEATAVEYGDTAQYYADSSKQLFEGCSDIANNLGNVADSLRVIADSQREVNEGVQGVNASLEQIAMASQDLTSVTDAAKSSCDSLLETVENLGN